MSEYRRALKTIRDERDVNLHRAAEPEYLRHWADSIKRALESEFYDRDMRETYGNRVQLEERLTWLEGIVTNVALDISNICEILAILIERDSPTVLVEPFHELSSPPKEK